MTLDPDANEAAPRPAHADRSTGGRSSTRRRADEDRGSTPPADGWHRLQAVVDAVPEAVVVVEPGGALRLTNEAADRLFAERPVVDRADLLSRFEAVGADGPRALSLAERRPSRGGGVIVRRRSQPTRWFSLRVVDLDGESARHGDAGSPPHRQAFVLRDVTDTREVRRLHEAFVGLVSHELRTPITTIYAGSTVLARERGLAPPATRMLARDVSAEAARLYDVVEDLLALARIERGVLEPLDAPVRVEQTIDAAVRVAAARHPTVRIRRGRGRPVPAARGDTTDLDHAVRNLVLAAIRRPGQPADVELDIESRADVDRGEVEVTLRDRGPSLATDDLRAAFDLPEVGGPDRALGGIPLHVARQLIEAMGGRVWARNAPAGEGLEIGFRLRVA